VSDRFITLTWEFIRDKDTTPQEKFILAEIEALSSLKKGCIGHNEHFADLLGVKKESVSRSINSLKEKGYIDVEIVKGSRNHDRRITLNKLLFRGKQNVIEGLTNCLETKGNKTINKTINNSIVQSGIERAKQDNRFDEFWTAYDKKVNRAKTEKIWAKLSDEDRNACLNAVGRYVLATPEKQFRKNPQTYLNNRGWEDEIVENQSKQQYQQKPIRKNWHEDLTDDEIVERMSKTVLPRLDDETKRYYGM
jgi:DNA-binding MarR family transcriptional regulator